MSDVPMIAERLKLIRQARNLSLDELSAAMDGLVTKQALSKYETGKDRPSPGVLRRLASALGVAASSLLESPNLRVEAIAFRKSASMGKKIQAHFDSLLKVRLEEAMGLRDLVDPDACFDVPVHEYKASSPEEAEAAAEALRKRWQLGEDPIPNLIDLLETAGVLVVQATGVDSFGGLSAVAYDERGAACGAAVMVHREFCLERQRLTLAHELAHVVLAVPEDVDGEKLAYRFGGAFLCPARTLRRDVGESRSQVRIEELRLLRSRYGMSMQAVFRRMLDLEIVSAALYKQGCIYFSRTGQRKGEDGQTEQGEMPSWMARTVYRALGEGLITRDRAEALLGEPVEGERSDTFIGSLRAMRPDERNRLIEAHLAAHATDDEGLDAEWMDAPTEAES